MRKIGLNNVQIMPTPLHPVVYGEWLGAGPNAKTVLVYGHYDIQPAVTSDGWDQDPFEPTVKDGVLYCRGSSDDKGQMFAQLKAFEALLANGKPTVNVKFLIEGEEEIGSPNLGKFVAAHPSSSLHTVSCSWQMSASSPMAASSRWTDRQLAIRRAV